MNYIISTNYSFSTFFNITTFQDIRHSLSYRKQITSYLGNNKLNRTQDKEYDKFPRPSPKHNRVHIQFCAF